MNRSILFKAGALTLVSVAWNCNAAPTTVLGLPLGGKFQISGACKGHSEPAKPCWVSAPFTSREGSRLGMANIPGGSLRPAWADAATVDVVLSKDSTLRSFKVTNHIGTSQPEITKSVTERFGPPNKVINSPAEGLSQRDWVSPGVEVRQFCTRDYCWVEFVSEEEAAGRKAEIEARKAKDSRRPTAP